MSTPKYSDQESLKQWLEFQFMEIHRKLNTVTEMQKQLQQAIIIEENRKVMFQ